MSRIWRKLVGPIVEFGFFAGLLYAINQLFYRSGSRFRIFCYEIMLQPISPKALAPASLTRKIHVREVERGDPLLNDMPPPMQVLDGRFDQGAICLAAFNGDSVLGYQWVCFGPYDEDEVRCTFIPTPTESTVFDFDFYIYPDHRFGIGFVALWDGTNAYLREKNIAFSCSRVSYFNTASRKSHRHFNWQRAGIAVFFCGKTWQLMISTLFPYLHFSFRESTYPKIVVPSDTVDRLPTP